MLAYYIITSCIYLTRRIQREVSETHTPLMPRLVSCKDYVSLVCWLSVCVCLRVCEQVSVCVANTGVWTEHEAERHTGQAGLTRACVSASRDTSCLSLI